MKEDVKHLKKNFFMAIFWLLLLLVIAVGSTYAWFSLSGRASTNITPMGGTVSDGDASLLISVNKSGPFDKTCDLVLDGNPDHLKPLSTLDLEKFYKATAQNRDGIAVLYTDATTKVNEDALHGTVYLKCENASCNVYFNKEELRLGSDNQALAAMRLGMKITSSSGVKTWIFRLDEMGSTGSAQSKRTVSQGGTVVSSVSSSGQASLTSDPSVGIGSYMAKSVGDSFSDGTNSLLTLKADEVATVEYWLYLEGCDDECFNPVQNRSSDFKLAFAGVDIKTND